MVLFKRIKSASFKVKLRFYLAYLFLPVCLLAFLNFSSVQNVIVEKMKYESSRIIKNIKISNIESYMSDIEHCLSVMKYEVDAHMLNDKTHQNTILKNWEYYKKFNKNISYIYIGTDEGNIFTYPGWTVPASYDPRQRPWYTKATESNGGIVWTDPYMDYTSDKQVLSVVSTIKDKTGKVRGVISIDSRYENLSNIVSSLTIGSNAYVFMTDNTGRVIANPKNTAIEPLFNSKDSWENILNTKEGVLFDNKRNIFISHTTINKTGWKVIGVIPDTTVHSLLTPVKNHTILVVYISLIIFVVIALLMQNRLDKEYVDLEKHIDMITGNTGSARSSAPYSGKIQKHFRPMLKQISTIKRQSITDSLTGLYNRGFITEELSSLIDNAVPFSLLLFDIDNFKSVNDTYGHAKGDQVLKHFARIINDNIRPEDMAARFGGEEFIIILKELDTQSAKNIAERIRLATWNTDWKLNGFKLSVSGGVSQYVSGSGEAIINHTDKLLYTAKALGKNRIEI